MDSKLPTRPRVGRSQWEDLICSTRGNGSVRACWDSRAGREAVQNSRPSPQRFPDGQLTRIPSSGLEPQYMQEASHKACMAQIRHLVHPIPSSHSQSTWPPGQEAGWCILWALGTSGTPVSPISQGQYQATLGQLRPGWGAGSPDRALLPARNYC